VVSARGTHSVADESCMKRGVSAKQQINTALTRLTGHHLAKGAPGEEREKSLAELRRLRRQVTALGGELDDARKASTVAKPRRPGFPRDYDQDARDIINRVRSHTMTTNEKLFALILAVRYIARYEVPGDIVECGVWRGGSMQAAALTLNQIGQQRELYLFDTFEGMSEPTEHDLRHDGVPAASLLETSASTSALWAVASLDDVKAGFETIEYPAEKIHYVPGKVEDTIPGQMPDQMSILRLDTDWYESTAHELRHMYDKLSPGGVLMLDDYGYWAGSRKATDEFIDRTGEPLLLLRMSEGRVAVKPWR
jgi:O-methyltransferase